MNCNNETALGQHTLGLLWDCMLLLLNGPSHAEGETAFVNLWIAAEFVPEAQRAAWPKKATLVSAALIEREYNTALRALKAQLHDSSSRGTVYKHLFAAATASTRGDDRLAALMATSRDVLELDATTATLISDLISAELPDFPYAPSLLTRAERETILALAILVLSTDDQKHILELTALRIIMLALNVTAANNALMAGLSKKGMSVLIDFLSAKALPAALLNIVRLVIADRTVHERERKAIKKISEKMPAHEYEAILKLAYLESGMRIKI